MDLFSLTTSFYLGLTGRKDGVEATVFPGCAMELFELLGGHLRLTMGYAWFYEELYGGHLTLWHLGLSFHLKHEEHYANTSERL